MSKLWCYLIFLTWISYLLSTGLLIFIDGFFLNRVARTEHSECTNCSSEGICEAEKIFKKFRDSTVTCLEPRSRVVLLVVDALKYEFLEWHDEEGSSSTYHRNRIPVVHRLLKKYPQNSRLYKFIADPPTTTMQRLKGITTGTLPTFIDVGSNFATESVEEDNLIDGIGKRGVVFMGDDTWTSLFPGKFIRQFPSPSFNVWDLDTVDREVRNRMTFELKKKDWSLLVAHTLGVDHCGHKHGQRHPEMARKLGETNVLIKEISEAIDDDTMMIVIGDHGMTESGDHGGDSPNEVEAGMFVYSKLPLISGFKNEDTKSVNQIDLVPTLASILGIPIPFSNIGTIIIDCLPKRNNKSDDHPWFAAHALWNNVLQTKTYIDAYSKESFLFTDDQLEQLNDMYNIVKKQATQVRDLESFQAFAKSSKSYLKLIRDLCAEIWVQFDAGLMSKGLVLVFCTLFFTYLLVNGVPEERMNKIMDSHFLLFAVGTIVVTSVTIYGLYKAKIIDEYKNTNFFATGAVSMALLVIVVVQSWDSISSTWYNGIRKQKINYLPRGILLLMFCGLFSNSYIVEEDKVLSFLLVTMIALLIYNAIDEDTNIIDYNNDRKIKTGKGLANPRGNKNLLILLGFVACAAIRVSSYFWRCREEQDQEACTNLTGKVGYSKPEGFERLVLTVSLIILALHVTVVRIWLKNCGNLSGFSTSITVVKYCPGVIVVCIGCYWVLQLLPKDAKVKLAVSAQVNALPGIVYFFVILGVLVLYAKPLGVYLMPRRSESINVYEGENIVPRLFDRVKELFYTNKTKEEPEIPVVYGLGTVYSAAFISLSVFITLVWALLLGHNLSLGAFMMFATCTAVLGVVAMERFRNADSVGE